MTDDQSVLGDPDLVHRLAVLLRPVLDGSVDRIFGQHRAVQLDGRQPELLRDLLVLDGVGLDAGNQAPSPETRVSIRPHAPISMG